MAEKKDITKLSKNELVEMLQRQEKMLLNRKFIKSLPDQGEKIYKLVDRLKEQIAIREQADDLSNRFKRITLAQNLNKGQKVELDSDDDDDDDETMAVNEKETALPAPPITAQEKSLGKQNAAKKHLSERWAYDSAITQTKPHVFEQTKVLSLEESRELQLKQKEEYEALRAKQAAEKLMQQINQTAGQIKPPTYKFSSQEARMKYRVEDEENGQDSDKESESEEKLYEQEQSDED